MTRRPTAREWIEENREVIWDLVRIYLGFALVIKGFVYMFQHRAMVTMLESVGTPFAGSALAEMVALAHIAGGLMLTFGILTRWGAIVQIPNLIGAILFVHMKEGLFTAGGSLEFAMLVLFLLVVVAVTGAGRLSIDWYFAEKRDRATSAIREPHPAE